MSQQALPTRRSVPPITDQVLLVEHAAYRAQERVLRPSHTTYVEHLHKHLQKELNKKYSLFVAY